MRLLYAIYSIVWYPTRQGVLDNWAIINVTNISSFFHISLMWNEKSGRLFNEKFTLVGTEIWNIPLLLMSMQFFSSVFLLIQNGRRNQNGGIHISEQPTQNEYQSKP